MISEFSVFLNLFIFIWLFLHFFQEANFKMSAGSKLANFLASVEKIVISKFKRNNIIAAAS